jgi:hypothetical protein
MYSVTFGGDGWQFGMAAKTWTGGLFQSGYQKMLDEGYDLRAEVPRDPITKVYIFLTRVDKERKVKGYYWKFDIATSEVEVYR